MEIAGKLIETLKKLSGLLSNAGFEFCLIGGLAVGIVAKPRATEDIDFLILITKDQEEPFQKLLLEHFNIMHLKQIMRFTNATIWRVLINPFTDEKNESIIVDFLLAENEIHFKTLANRFDLQVDDIFIPIASPSDLIAIKRLAGRPQDLLDIHAIEEENTNQF